MKRRASLLFICILLVGIAAGCSTTKVKWTLDKKHQPFPDYVLNSSAKVRETYIMASKYPKVVASVPCFCGCLVEGHKNNMNCFIQKMGKNNAVEQWDSHGISCDICINIAQDAVQMHLDGKNPKEIYHLITEKYKDMGDPTPTPEPK
jgi:Protein of unknown function with PCYCGC motif